MRMRADKSHQTGTTTVEFAFIGFLLFLILFGTIEVARLMFVMNTLGEMTRRAARTAVVCPVNHVDIEKIGLINEPGSGDTSRYLNNFTVANFNVEYLDEFGAPTTNFPDIDFIRVSIVNYQHQFLVPLFDITINSPNFTTTLPVESLGYIPELNTRECFGSA